MLGLFNTYDHATKELMQSLAAADISYKPVFIQYNGALPDGALCPFVTYTGIKRQGDPLFFNQVPVPPWCEIRQGVEVFGEILRDGCVMGKINYEPNSFRQVDSVDWFLPDHNVSHTDHYDRQGNFYATTYYSNGLAYQTAYRGPGEWAIEVNHVARIVTMFSPRQLLTFASLTDFVSFFLDDQGLLEPHVLINSLSFPLFVMRQRAAKPNTTLFWQEPMLGEVPGNMGLELNQPKALTRIVFCDQQLQQQVAKLHPETALELTYLSHLGQFAEHDNYDPNRVFTLTNSDEIPGLADLLEAFPEVTFSVAAPTLMSEKLHALGRQFANLKLSPTINHKSIAEELARASVYLDINAGPHVLDVVKAAYHLNLVVFALAPHAKAPDYSRVFSTSDELQINLAAVVSSPQARIQALDKLHSQHGPPTTAADYQRVFKQRPGSRS